MQVFMKRWSWVAAVAGLAMYSNNAKAVFYSEQYEMTFDPSTVAGTVNGHVLGIGSGSGTNGPSGSVISGGAMHFLDDAASSGNQGYFLPPSDTLLIGSTNYIADFRMRSNVNQTPATGKSLSFKSNSVGRGLQINGPAGTAVFVNGSGPVGTPGSGTFGAYTQYRVIVDGSAANTISLYTNTTGTVNTAASVGNYTLVTTTTMGGSGYAGELGAIGFALGSLSGSGTTNANFDMDWFCVESGTTDLNSIWEGNGQCGVPEPATLAMLVLGCVPMVIRRRRAA